MRIKFKALRPDAVLPTYGSEGAAGLDLYATGYKRLQSGLLIVSTSLAVELPPNTVGKVYLRSSLAKRGFTLANSVGIIDSDYRGEILLMLRGHNMEQLQVGERIGQVLIEEIEQHSVEFAEELSSTERGEGGFGSTGRK